jgi:peptide deformylase
MDPFTIAMLLSAGSSAAGVGLGALQAGQAQRAANVQNDLAMRQFYINRRIAQQQEEMARAGTRNARGDVTEYVPGVGWVERQVL